MEEVVPFLCRKLAGERLIPMANIREIAGKRSSYCLNFTYSGTADPPAIIITTRKSHTERSDFPQLKASEGNISMLPHSAKQTFASLSAPATRALNENNVLFMFEHGTPARIVGTQVDAFAEIDFSDELVFCGSCMSASPYSANRLNLDAKKDSKRFAFHAMDNGSVMMLGHMGLCGGFPKVYPMAELVLAGLSAGEAYQRLMNSLIGGKPFPPITLSRCPQGRPPRSGKRPALYPLGRSGIDSDQELIGRERLPSSRSLIVRLDSFRVPYSAAALVCLGDVGVGRFLFIRREQLA